MTENEAIKVLEKPSKHIRMVHKTKNEMEFYTFSSDLVEAFETAIQALEEIQQYRAIGTVEEFIDKLIERLEEQHERCINRYGIVGGNAAAMEVKQCIDIVNELAEEYKVSEMPKDKEVN